ncbi:MAG: hypothetical protein SGILL_002305 [Bacillariaceae sp.]
MVLATHLFVFGLLKSYEVAADSHGEDGSDAFQNQMVLATFIACSWHIFWYWQGKGAASLKEMVEDVSNALTFVDKHIDDWWQSDDSDSDSKSDDDKIPIIFGGYSSGAHVSATLMQSPSLTPLASANDSTSATTLKNMEIVHVMYISGFLHPAPDSFVGTSMTLAALNEWPSNVHSPFETLKAQGSVRTRRRPKEPPHTLIGCQNEIFGLPILLSAFCSKDYATTLNENNGDGSAEWIPLKDWTANHWSVLATMGLRRVMHDSLRKVFEEDDVSLKDN